MELFLDALMQCAIFSIQKEMCRKGTSLSIFCLELSVILQIRHFFRGDKSAGAAITSGRRLTTQAQVISTVAGAFHDKGHVRLTFNGPLVDVKFLRRENLADAFRLDCDAFFGFCRNDRIHAGLPGRQGSCGRASWNTDQSAMSERALSAPGR